MKRNVSAIVLFLLLSLFLNFTVAAAHYTFLQQGIAEEVVRFHVLANSDSEEDQAVKYLVRDAILTWIADEMQDAKEEPQSEQTERAAILQFLSENLSKLEENANRILEEQGKSYSAQAEIAWCYFPDRTYGSYTFPAGWYQALRIRLGEAAGQNWWCLLYPALCFSDCLHAAISDNGQTKLEENLTVEEYQLLLKNPSQWKIAFRWADFLN
ncbi:MAG: stage II sporulation protein R [Clostridiales bacterium]|nr:stage II sporulation protein R [Clostridiales bacterium]